MREILAQEPMSNLFISCLIIIVCHLEEKKLHPSLQNDCWETKNNFWLNAYRLMEFHTRILILKHSNLSFVIAVRAALLLLWGPSLVFIAHRLVPDITVCGGRRRHSHQTHVVGFCVGTGGREKTQWVMGSQAHTHRTDWQSRILMQWFILLICFIIWIPQFANLQLWE